MQKKPYGYVVVVEELVENGDVNEGCVGPFATLTAAQQELAKLKQDARVAETTIYALTEIEK